MMRYPHLVFAGAVIGVCCTVAQAVDAPLLSPGVSQRAKVNYLVHCAGCHLPDGHGSPGTVPDLREYLGQFAQHPESRSFIARVPGSSGSPLSNAELTEVLNWILVTMNGDQLHPDFKPYTEEEVARYRRDTLIDVGPVRQALIEKVAAGN